ncbi:MAG: cytochrome c oxidase assembly protein, partial [Hyphomicrobium sp.]|nr:cytochrome c oxidase assembly protein [Hyphomicrobium sp.]
AINPATILTTIYALYSLWLIRRHGSTRAGAMGLFTCFLCGFLVLTMIAAPLLVMGSPLTLAFRASGPAWRKRLRAGYRGRIISALTHPIAGWVAFAITTYAWQFSRLAEFATRSLLVREIQLGSLLFVSLMFWMPALCADPLRWRMAHPLRILYVLIEMVHKALFGGMFLSMESPFHKNFSANPPSWAPEALLDQRLSIAILWLGGNMVFMVVLFGLAVHWLRYEGRQSRRVDLRLAKAREKDKRRMAALEAVFNRGS